MPWIRRLPNAPKSISVPSFIRKSKRILERYFQILHTTVSRSMIPVFIVKTSGFTECREAFERCVFNAYCKNDCTSQNAISSKNMRFNFGVNGYSPSHMSRFWPNENGESKFSGLARAQNLTMNVEAKTNGSDSSRRQQDQSNSSQNKPIVKYLLGIKKPGKPSYLSFRILFNWKLTLAELRMVREEEKSKVR